MQWTDVPAEIQRFGSRNYMRMVYASKKHEEEAFWAKQKSRIELFYTYNYQGIKNFTYTDTKKLPTGTTVISGYVNDNPSLSFEADVPSEMLFESQRTRKVRTIKLKNFLMAFHTSSLKHEKRLRFYS